MNAEILSKVLEQTLMLVILGFIGFIAGKTGYLPKETGKHLSGVVVKITAPLLIFSSMAGYAFTPKILRDGISLYFAGIIFVLVAFVISNVHVKMFKLNDSTKSIYQLHSMFGNVVFLSFPLLSIMFGDKGIVYATFFNIGNDTILWTLGMYLLNRHKVENGKFVAKHLINSNTIAFLLGILIMTARYTWGGQIASQYWISSGSKYIFDTILPLGRTTIYLSMLFIGLILSEIELKGFFDFKKRIVVFTLSIIKLTMMPTVALLVFSIIGNLIDPFSIKIIVIQLAMPCATIIPALAAQHGSDYKFATEAVMISTILFFATMPLVVSLLG